MKNILHQDIREKKTVIIENELGEVGIDGELLESSGLEIKEIYSGCICCTLQGDLTKALEEVHDRFHPERVFIEPSGVAKLSLLLKDLEVYPQGELGLVATVVDPLRYEMYSKNFTAFYMDQIEVASVILLSRTQLLEERSLQEIIQRIKDYNKRALIITKPWSQLDTRELLDRETFKRDWQELFKDMHLENPFEVYGLKTEKNYPYQRLEEILKSFDDSKTFGTVIRAKGILRGEDRWYQLDYSGGERRLAPLSEGQRGRICVIGKDLKKGPLASLLS